jgi:cob(I)alamin adenosyltransferase
MYVHKEDLMKVYTGTGDRGKTSLFSGERVSKANLQIEVYGEIDELNSIIGALVAALDPEQADLVDELEHIQSNLFDISAILATTPDSPSMNQLRSFSREEFDALEKTIDARQDELTELKGFILPGGHMTAAWSHIARTVCRRIERQMVSFLTEYFQGEIPEQYRNAQIYLNRLSDYFFVIARYCNHISGTAEKLWKK